MLQVQCRLQLQVQHSQLLVASLSCWRLQCCCSKLGCRNSQCW
jgi:hypothetical protein